MIIKDVVLSSEKRKIMDFLEKSGLKYEQNIDRTIYIEDGDKVAGTVSASGYIIKCLAVDADYRGENLAVQLVGEMIKRLHAAGIYYYQVFTKTDYRQVFESFGFRLLVQTAKTAVMEGGEGDIETAIDKLKTQAKFNLGLYCDEAPCDIGCIVLNGNPFTAGHLQLAEYALQKHSFLLVFVLEEEGSYFGFKERYAMAYLALKPYANVLVLPSTKYIVSRATFPGYFLKSADETTAEYAEFDALIFRDYFMPKLGIAKRYIGTEVSDYMQIYNDTLQKVLGEKVETLPRFTENGEVVSAKKVRALISENKISEALEYVPVSNRALLSALIASRGDEN